METGSTGGLIAEPIYFTSKIKTPLVYCLVLQLCPNDVRAIPHVTKYFDVGPFSAR
jgi:hypothetical protein